MNLASKKLRKQIRKEPMALVSMIIANNPEGVKAALQSNYGEVVNLNDPQGMIDAIYHQLSLYPEQASQIIMDVLSVPIISERLDDVSQDWLLDELVANDTSRRRRTMQYREGGGGPADPDIDISPTAGEGGDDQDDDENNFNWGALVTGLLPGILSGFGFGKNPTNSGSGAGTPPKKDHTWVWLVVIVFLIILAFFLFKKKE